MNLAKLQIPGRIPLFEVSQPRLVQTTARARIFVHFILNRKTVHTSTLRAQF
ncbi:hypothetical protein M5D96_012683 [Drosophila gunungcola]|uniref:Uncharacterized protein n=1 Tax=Drosophila gunungcola TaxID=103775 RepID=A0A9P9YCM5_9MUSC|nr:hypothetical protein M5D96_012683 [Drosophila gunungcola]